MGLKTLFFKLLLPSDYKFTPCCSSSQGGTTKRKQSRKRIIIQLPANGGQDCPEVLYQEKECEAPSVCPGFR